MRHQSARENLHLHAHRLDRILSFIFRIITELSAATESPPKARYLRRRYLIRCDSCCEGSGIDLIENESKNPFEFHEITSMNQNSPRISFHESGMMFEACILIHLK